MWLRLRPPWARDRTWRRCRPLRSGVSRLVWLRMLKNSARNCRPRRSVRCALRVAEKSSSERPGPVSALRETLP